MAEIYPSLISSDILNLEKQINMLDSHVDGYHIDIMDFNFVPNLTWGPLFSNAIRLIAKQPLYIHLMVCNPLQYLDRLHINQNDYISFHLERCPDTVLIDYIYALDLIKKIKEIGAKASIAIKPSTPITALEPIVEAVQDVLLMSVEPGFSGQAFMDISYERLEELCLLRNRSSYRFTISMDGGINEHNITKLSKMGVDIFGIASAIFNREEPLEALKNLKKLSN